MVPPSPAPALAPSLKASPPSAPWSHLSRAPPSSTRPPRTPPTPSPKPRSSHPSPTPPPPMPPTPPPPPPNLGRPQPPRTPHPSSHPGPASRSSASLPRSPLPFPPTKSRPKHTPALATYSQPSRYPQDPVIGRSVSRYPQGDTRGGPSTEPMIDPFKDTFTPRATGFQAVGTMLQGTMNRESTMHSAESLVAKPLENYIPLRFTELRDNLIREFPAAFADTGVKKKFRELCKWLALRNSLRLELDFASAHETYALLDPDHDTVKADDDTLCGLLSP
ncbi:MAG: hypothetical protein WDW38_009658 [Sanguina aurantia]